MANEQSNQPDIIEEQKSEEQKAHEKTAVEVTKETEKEGAAVTEAGDESQLTLEQALARIEALQIEAEEAKNQALRHQAEAQNEIRRARQDVEKARKFALEKFVDDLLPVVDNLERAIAAMDSEQENLKAVTEGIELTLKSFQDTLKRHNVEAIDPEGQPFDPKYHQAMTMVENAEVEPNTVINVFQKGYMLNERLVRPAMVVVAKAPANQNA